jgi:hypothetical protein
MIWRRNHHGIHILAFQGFAKIGIGFGLSALPILYTGYAF